MDSGKSCRVQRPNSTQASPPFHCSLLVSLLVTWFFTLGNAHHGQPGFVCIFRGLSLGARLPPEASLTNRVASCAPALHFDRFELQGDPCRHQSNHLGGRRGRVSAVQVCHHHRLSAPAGEQSASKIWDERVADVFSSVAPSTRVSVSGTARHWCCPIAASSPRLLFDSKTVTNQPSRYKPL